MDCRQGKSGSREKERTRRREISLGRAFPLPPGGNHMLPGFMSALPSVPLPPSLTRGRVFASRSPFPAKLPEARRFLLPSSLLRVEFFSSRTLFFRTSSCGLPSGIGRSILLSFFSGYADDMLGCLRSQHIFPLCFTTGMRMHSLCFQNPLGCNHFSRLLTRFHV